MDKEIKVTETDTHFILEDGEKLSKKDYALVKGYIVIKGSKVYH